MGLAPCGLFHFTKHPTAVRKNIDSRASNLLRFQCFLETSSSPVRSVCKGLITEDKISLIQRSFIWVLFIPYTAHSHLWSQSTWFNFSFTSYSPDLSVESCGMNIVYRQNMEEFTRMMARHSITSPFDWFPGDIINIDPKTVYSMWDNFPEIFIEATSSSEYLHPQRLFISQGDTSVTAQYSYHEDDPYPDNQFRVRILKPGKLFIWFCIHVWENYIISPMFMTYFRIDHMFLILSIKTPNKIELIWTLCSSPLFMFIILVFYRSRFIN